MKDKPTNRRLSKDFINSTAKKIRDGQNVSDRELKRMFSLLNEIDTYALSQERKKYLKMLLRLKTQLLVDKVVRSDDKENLTMCCEYAVRLIKENLNNYRSLEALSSLGMVSPTVEDAAEYFDFFMYSSHLNRLVHEFVEDIHQRPSNSSLAITLMSLDEKETKLRDKYTISIESVGGKLNSKNKGFAR